MIQLFSNVNYTRLENKLLSAVGLPKFGLLSQALDQLVHLIHHNEKKYQNVDYEIYLQEKIN